MNLRDAADRIRVLHLAGDGLAGKAAVLEDIPQVLRAVDLPRVPAQQMHTRIKRLGDAALRLAGQGSDDVRVLRELHGVVHAERADGGHHLCAVDQRKPLFCL